VALSNLWNAAGGNVLELWDCGDCSPGGNNVYLAPFNIVHVLKVEPVSIQFSAPPCDGFDDWTGFAANYPTEHDLRIWLSVPATSSNSVNTIITTTNILPHITFDTVDPGIATVSPSTASGESTILDVTGGASTEITNTLVNVKFKGVVMAQFWADVLPPATAVTVALHQIARESPSGTVTPTNVPDAVSLGLYLDSVFGKQANVYADVLLVNEVTVNYDLNTNGVLDISQSLLLSDEVAAITNAAHVAGAMNVYYVSGFPTNCGFVGLSTKYPNWTFIQDTHDNSHLNITAHELGHQFRIGYDVGKDVTGLPDRLMWAYMEATNSYRLIKSEWRRIYRT
jgi:hypothetical protein